MKTIYIDLGKTIVDNKGYDFIASYTSLYNQTDKQIPLDEFLLIDKVDYKKEKLKTWEDNSEINISNFLDRMFRKYNVTCNIDKEEYLFDEITKYEGLMAGAKELLAYFKKQKYQVIAVSNSCFSGKVLEKCLKHHNIIQYFDKVISSADVLVKKPRTEIFAYAKRFQIYEDCYFIGNDYICDVVGPSFVNIKPIWINLHNEEDKLNLAYKVVKNCFEIIDLI